MGYILVINLQTLTWYYKISGIVFTRTACDSDESKVKLLKRGVKNDQFSIDNLPPVITPPEISTDRAQYLYDQVREFVYPEFRDVLCPCPT